LVVGEGLGGADQMSADLYKYLISAMVASLVTSTAMPHLEKRCNGILIRVIINFFIFTFIFLAIHDLVLPLFSTL
jgi:uncharacterized membrane protein required for colicin V production